MYAPNGFWFGCGPKNRRDPRLKSVPLGDAVVANWKPKPHHVAFGKAGSRGIISVLMDCHGNQAAAHALMGARNLPSPPDTVTSEYAVRFLHPSPTYTRRQFSARATKVEAAG
jgi:hypothetical protein